MKRVRAFVVGVLLLLSGCMSAFAMTPTRSQAEYECANAAIMFVQQYLAAKEAGASPQELVDALRGSAAEVAKARRFIEAESRGDIETAKAVLNELFVTCVDARLNPKLEV